MVDAGLGVGKLGQRLSEAAAAHACPPAAAHPSYLFIWPDRSNPVQTSHQLTKISFEMLDTNLVSVAFGRPFEMPIF